MNIWYLIEAENTRSRKHNQSSLQIAANSIINDNQSNWPHLNNNATFGLPPKDNNYK